MKKFFSLLLCCKVVLCSEKSCTKTWFTHCRGTSLTARNLKQRPARFWLSLSVHLTVQSSRLRAEWSQAALECIIWLINDWTCVIPWEVHDKARDKEAGFFLYRIWLIIILFSQHLMCVSFFFQGQNGHMMVSGSIVWHSNTGLKWNQCE